MKMEQQELNTTIYKYNSEKSINLFNFVKNNFNWESIQKWQNSEDIQFPVNDITIDKNNTNDIIHFLMSYPIKFDIENNNIEMYKKRIENIYKQITLFKPIKNPDIEIFKIFDQPLFNYFIHKNIPDDSLNSFKKPSSIFSCTLNPVYNNFVDKKTIKSNSLLIYNDKNVLILESGYSAAMSFPHFLCIPNERIYNCITLNIDNISLIKDMINNTQEFFNKNFTKCLAEFGARSIYYILENPNTFIDNFDLIEKNNVVNIFVEILNKTYIENKNNKNIKIIYNNLLDKLNKSNIINNNKELDFYFHVHPFHGIGYLHMQCLYSPLKTRSWNHFIYQFINVNDVINILENNTK